MHRLALALSAALAVCGCFSTGRHRPEVPPTAPEKPINAAEVYQLACPDVIEVIFTQRPDQGHLAKIGADGCIQVAGLGSIAVEGQTSAEAAALIADRVGLPAAQVLVQVVEYNSRQVFLFGPGHGEQRAVDYRGPETIVELLNRAGGLAPEAAPDEIHIVRAQLGEGIPAEVLTIDLEAIQERNDQRTNVRIQPLDEVYVGEQPRSRIGKAMPTILKPLYENLVDLIPPRSPRPVPVEPRLTR